MSRALVTGSAGFIGRRVVDRLRAEGHEVDCFDITDPERQLAEQVRGAEFIFHFAGVNRPSNESDFDRVNAGLTRELCDYVRKSGKNPVVVLSSSTQAALDNPYGRSKRNAEETVERFARDGGRAAIFRFPNVFGPGCRPNYNSVVATFAYNTAHGKPLEVHDPSRELTLVYVHDVATAMIDVVRDPPPTGDAQYRDATPAVKTNLGSLAATFAEYGSSRRNAMTPRIASDFERKLYATYLSYLDPADFAYDLISRSDDRGSLGEFLKSATAGQLFISRTLPGKTRGNHFHHTKTEKFFVVEGTGVIRFRRVDGTGDMLEYPVSGTDFRVVDIPPDYAHSIENVGATDMVVLFWASEIFDPAAPDTFPLNV